MKWITREKAKVDRIACPWLIKKFIDPQAELIFVPADKVLAEAKRVGGISYDAPGAELTHFKEDGKDYVSFDAIIKKHGLKDPALLELAKIVRGADAKIPDAPRESAGLEAAALGFRVLAKDDFDNMRMQFPMYDALYKFCQQKVETGAKLDHSGS
ncbi:MAG TPA: chromate resistance protein ChrB domain-containing protein [Nitrososphaerales archaeon]|nr:chromate resistance protein ChrB domain-containing protein [Nitrososphaerales archaeon]